MKPIGETVLAPLVFLLLATSAGAQEQMSLVQPPGQHLIPTKVQTKDGSAAEFTGEMWVSGTLVATWPAGPNALAYKYPDFILVPDSRSQRMLPYFVLKEAKQTIRYRVTSIDIGNGADALRMAARRKEAEQLLDRGIGEVKVTGSFLLDTYTVSVECDSPWAHANIVRVKLPDSKKMAALHLPERC